MNMIKIYEHMSLCQLEQLVKIRKASKSKNCRIKIRMNDPTT